MSARASPLLEADRVVVARRSLQVIKTVSAAFDAGEWTAVVGPNGAGKSTFLALLAGLLLPLTGAVRLGGRPLVDYSARERAARLTWFGQTSALEGDIAALEVVRLGRLPRFGLLGAPDATDEAAVRAAMDETEATPFAGRRLNELSAGERQRVLLARAFAADATVCLYDEPTIHLDAPHQRRLIQSLISRARAGAAVISVLHDLTLALAADRLIVMAGGKIRADGRPGDEIVRDALTTVFEHAFTIQRLGPPESARWAAVPII